MKLNLFLYLSSTLLLLSACKKDDDSPVSYPSTYHSARFESVSKVKLYTQAGEVTSPAVIDDYSQRYGENFLYKDGISTHPSPADTIQLQSKNAAQFTEGTRTSSYKPARRGEVLYFIPADTAVNYVQSSYDFEMVVAMGKHKPLYQQVIPLSWATGYDFRHDVLMERFATVKGKQLVFPLLNYVFTRRSATSFSINKHVLNNTFDPSALQLLKPGDTLAVQELQVVFEK